MEDRSSDLPSLSRLAIEAALNCDWEKAIELNLAIAEADSINVSSRNRLAKAYFELGKFSEAKKVYQEVLKLDPYNLIAQKNLKKVSQFKENGKNLLSDTVKHKLSASLFLQEPGITKIVNLVKLAEPNKLSLLSAGMEVKVSPKNRGVSITDMEDVYLGVLPDDLAHQLLRLIKGGNKYQALIKSVKSNALCILIRETFRSRKFKNQPSFLAESNAFTISSDHISLNTDSVEESGDPEDSEA